MLMLFALFAFALVSNIAIALVPHEPVIIWFGARMGVWPTAVVATAGNLSAAWIDHRLFVPLIDKVGEARSLSTGLIGLLRRWFGHAPFMVLVLSGLAPLPFWPFKVMAFGAGYPLRSYLLAVSVGRLPRYVLLAWLGVVLTIPTWVFLIITVLLIVTSVATSLNSLRAQLDAIRKFASGLREYNTH